MLTHSRRIILKFFTDLKLIRQEKMISQRRERIGIASGLDMMDQGSLVNSEIAC